MTAPFVREVAKPKGWLPRRNLFFRALAAIAAVMVSSSHCFAGFHVITTVGTSQSFGDATFSSVTSAVGGSGVLDPFLRISDNADTTWGFNNDQSKSANNPHIDDAKTHSLTIASVPLVSGAREFVLDINQTNTRNTYGETVSLEKFQVYLSSDSNISTLSAVQTTGTLVYNLDAEEDRTLVLSNHESGSGKFDYVITIAESAFSSAYAPGRVYVYLYSEFGRSENIVINGTTYNLANNAGFEEYGVRVGSGGNPSIQQVTTPAPPSAIAALSGLAIFGLVGFVRLRRRPQPAFAA